MGWEAGVSGTIVTHPLEIRRYQDRIHLIADSSRGAIFAELLTADGEVIPGCSRQDCEEISARGNQLPIRWKGDPDLEPIFRTAPVRLKLYMRNATVYGIRVFRPPESTGH